MSSVLFASLRGYRRDWIVRDLAAGALLAGIAIPEQVATARLAGMPPETGLYAFAAASLAFVIFGVNRYLSVGADSTIAPIFAATIATFAPMHSPEYVRCVGVVALLAGGILLIAGMLRAGWISEMLSTPVTIGFLAGISIHIIAAELPALLGISVREAAPLLQIFQVARELAHVNGATLALGVGVLGVTLAGKRISPKVPGALAGIVAAAGLVMTLHLRTHGVAVLGALNAELPRFVGPAVRGSDIERLLPLALIVAMVCMVQTATVLRAFPSRTGEAEESSRDFAAVGIGSIAAALVGSFAVDASPPRTAVVQTSGGRSQLGSLVAVAATALLVLFGANLTSYVPESALAAVLVFIATRIFRLGDMVRIVRESRLEIGLVVVPAVLVVALPINTGMMLSIFLSLLYGLHVMVRPPCVELTHVPGTTIWWPPERDSAGERIPGIVVFAPAAPIYFLNVRYIVERLNAAVAAAPDPVKLAVIEGSGVIDVDYTGAVVLKAAFKRLGERGIRVAVARLSDERAEAAACRTGLMHDVGEGRNFKSVDEAIRRLS